VSDPDAQQRFARRTGDRPGEPRKLPSKVDDLDAFAAELDAIENRIEKVLERRRESFIEGSDTFDHASMAIIHLAALFEDERFVRLLTPVTDVERRGIATTRNVVAHRGYRTMDDERLWLTITTDVPDVLRRVRTHLAGRRD
jgi:hypothetical protein